MSWVFCSHFGLAVGVGLVVGRSVGAPGFFSFVFRRICPCNEALKASIYDPGSFGTGHEKRVQWQCSEEITNYFIYVMDTRLDKITG